VPEDIRRRLRNNAAHVNHSMFWTIMAPKGSAANKRRLADASRRRSHPGDLKTKLADAGTKRSPDGLV